MNENENPQEELNQEQPNTENNPDVENAEKIINEAAAEAEKEQDEKPEKEKDGKKKKEKPQDKIQEMGEKLAEMNDKYVRLYSEFENYRKRTSAEKADLILNGGKDVMKAILPIVDDMERALQNTQDEAAREGLQLIFNKLMTTLQQKGLKPIECKGEKFDENIHDAVMQMPAADETQKNIIMDVVEKGYYLNDKVLRHPKVVVAI
ncbi:MAG: nucleotide exchange factor GrpE [Bacteroidales bacterium]|nr:nucleotide exchange factor GrpE [Bacteroidales bacterium]